MNSSTKTYLFAFLTLFGPSTSTILPQDSVNDLLGFDPKLSTITAAHETHKTPVITVLGFPDPEGMYSDKFDTERTFTVTFRFHNTYLYSQKSLSLIPTLHAINSINLGQEPDATVLLYVIAQCYRQGHKKVHIFGNSRGGATTIKMLDMLSNPQKYHQIWHKIGICDPIEQLAIQEMVAAGNIYLAHPLMNYKVGIQLTAQRIIQPCNHYTHWLLSSVGQKGLVLASGINHTLFAGTRYMLFHALQGLLLLATHYSYTSENPVDILKNAILDQNWPYTLTIALAKEDCFVGHEHETVLKLLSHYPASHLTVTPGGEHHFDIRQQLKDFRLKFSQNS